MSRQEVLEQMTAIAAEHHPHPVFGCECTDVWPSGHPLEGQKLVMNIPWEQHIAEMMLEAARGF